MALEAILITALLAAHLAVPTELAKPFGFDAVADLHPSLASQHHIVTQTCHTNLQTALDAHDAFLGAAEQAPKCTCRDGGMYSTHSFACKRELQRTALGVRKSFFPMLERRRPFRLAYEASVQAALRPTASRTA
jgi:hypothetical protein